MQKPNIPPVNVIFIAGQSGTGKGTQGTMLREYLTQLGVSVATIINGDLIREYIKGDSPMALLVRKRVTAGHLVLTKTLYRLVLKEFKRLMNEPDNPLILWDGSPRREEEAVYFAEVFSKMGIGAVTLYLSGVDDTTCEERIIHRAELTGRPEDPRRKIDSHYGPGNGADMLKLIETMEPSPQWPILHIPIDALGTPEEVHARIRVKLSELQGYELISLPVYLG